MITNPVEKVSFSMVIMNLFYHRFFRELVFSLKGPWRLFGNPFFEIFAALCQDIEWFIVSFHYTLGSLRTGLIESFCIHSLEKFQTL